MDAYERTRDEIRQVLEIAAARFEEGVAEGHKAGLVEGVLEGKRDTLLRLLKRAGFEVKEDERARIQACMDIALLDRWIEGVFGAKDVGDALG